jgi:hypothetical protein
MARTFVCSPLAGLEEKIYDIAWMGEEEEEIRNEIGKPWSVKERNVKLMCSRLEFLCSLILHSQSL